MLSQQSFVSLSSIARSKFGNLNQTKPIQIAGENIQKLVLILLNRLKWLIKPPINLVKNTMGHLKKGACLTWKNNNLF